MTLAATLQCRDAVGAESVASLADELAHQFLRLLFSALLIPCGQNLMPCHIISKAAPAFSQAAV